MVQNEPVPPTVEDLEQVLTKSRSRIAELAGAHAAEATARIRESVGRQLPSLVSRAALEGYVKAAMADLELGPLMERAQAGDRLAFDQMWYRLAPDLRDVIRMSRRLSDYDREVVETGLAETLWKRTGEYDASKTPVYAWARGFARNAARFHRPEPAGGPSEDQLERERRKRNQAPQPERSRRLPPPYVTPEVRAEVMALLLDQEPHMVVAFFFNRFLGWKPERIVEVLGSERLASLPLQALEEAERRDPVLGVLRGPLQKLAELWQITGAQADKPCETTLADCCGGELTPSVISHWSHGAARAVRSKVLQMAKQFLRLVAELTPPAFEKFPYLWRHVLRRLPADLEEMAGCTLAGILQVFRGDCPRLTGLEAEQVESATEPMAEQIRTYTRPLLRDYAAGDLRADLARWLQNVERKLAPLLRKEHVLAYAYLSGGFNTAARAAAGGAGWGL